MKYRRILLSIVVASAGLLVAYDGTHRSTALLAADDSASSVHGTLVRYEPLSAECLRPAAPDHAKRRPASPKAARQAGGPRIVGSPIRTIKDPYPSFAAVAVDAERNEVVFTDESLFQILVYDRLES